MKDSKVLKEYLMSLLKELCVWDDPQQNERIINEYANEHDITVT